MANTTNFGWETPDDTDLVKDGALAMRTLGNAIDASLVDLKGGTTGQVLSKNTNTDMDFTWITQNDADAIQNSIVDAKGDLISATADNTPARLASSGINGQVLTIDTSTSTGLKWAAVAAGGKVLQVVSAVDTTQTSSTSTNWADTGLSASITPSSTSSKILILVAQFIGVDRLAGRAGGGLRLLRGSTFIHGDNVANSPYSFFFQMGGVSASRTELYGRQSLIYLDSPNTTSSTTYKTQFAVENATSGGIIYSEVAGVLESSITLLEIGA